MDKNRYKSKEKKRAYARALKSEGHPHHKGTETLNDQDKNLEMPTT